MCFKILIIPKYWWWTLY